MRLRRKVDDVEIQIDRAFPNRVSALHGPVLLREREGVSSGLLFDHDTGLQKRRARAANGMRVHADAVADAPGGPTSIAKGEAHRFVCLPRGYEDRRRHLHGAILYRDDVSARKAESFRGARRNESRVVPGELRYGVGELLEPGVVGKASVMDSRGKCEKELQPTLRLGSFPRERLQNEILALVVE